MTIKRRDFVVLTSAAVAIQTLDFSKLAIASSADQADGIYGQGKWKYRQLKGWGVQDPAKVPINNLHEIVQDRAGNIYVLGDHSKNNILVYKPDGTLVKTLLDGLNAGHGLNISQEDGTEFLWVTNTDGNNAFVRKITLDGETVLEIKRPTEGPYANPEVRYLPTEVEINPKNGDIYIADGYGANLLTHYDKTGKLLNIYGNFDDPKQRYNCMHGVRLDFRNPEHPLLWLTSRVDQEIRLVTLDGELKEIIKFPGVGPCRATFVGDHVVIPIIWVDPIGDAGRGPGFVLILGPDNKPVSMIGGRQRELESGEKHFAQEQRENIPFIFPHDTYIDAKGDLYVAQWNSSQTYPLKFERIA